MSFHQPPPPSSHLQPPCVIYYTSSLPQYHYSPLPYHLSHEDLMLNYHYRVYYLDHHHHHSQPLRPPPQPPPFSQPYSSPFQSLSQIYSSPPPSQFSPSPQWQTPNTPPRQLPFAGHTPVRDSFSEIREKLLKLKVDLATTPKLIPISKAADDAYVWEGKHRSENREKSKVPDLNKRPPFHTQSSPLKIASGNKENKKKACHLELQRAPWSPPQAPPLAPSPEMVPPSPGLASNENKGREEESAISRRELPRAPPRKLLPPPPGIPLPTALPEVTSAEIAKLFPHLFGQPSAALVPSEDSDASLPVYHSGGQAPGGSVFSGIFAKGSSLWLQRLCSGKEKLATPEQFTQAQETTQELYLVGLCGQKPNFTISSTGHCYSGFNLAFESDYLALENYYANADNCHKGFNLEGKVDFEGAGDVTILSIKIKRIIRLVWRKGIG